MINIIEKAHSRGLSIDTHVAEQLLNPAAVIIFGVSGGKDSDTMVLETLDYLTEINFPGDVAMIHSDLGLIEHSASIGQCERLAVKTGLPLTVVRPARPLIERWFNRWEGIRQRFVDLERVKLVMPFSSSAARFCSGESKVVPITAELKRRFPGKFIINAVGIRSDESKARAKKPIWQVNDKLKSKTHNTNGIDWFPILRFSLESIWLSHKKHNFKVHEAYDRFDMQRVSCSFCVLASRSDLQNSLRDERNHPAFREIVKLELVSGFSFRQNDWLADYGTHLLSQSELNQLAYAKELSAQRQYLESNVEKDMFFVKDGFPAFQPTMQQSDNLAEFRRKISLLYNLPSKYLTGETVWHRYADLLKLKAEKESKKK